MRRTPVLERRRVWIRRPVAEKVNEHFAFASFRLQPRPGPGGPGKGPVAEHVAGGTKSFRVRPTGIRSQNFVGIFAIAGTNGLLIRVGLCERDKKRALVGISADQDGRVVVALG